MKTLYDNDSTQRLHLLALSCEVQSFLHMWYHMDNHSNYALTLAMP